jgi:tetratricopeptide (TPR) repeat protein
MRKKKLHAHIARTMEELYRETLDEHSGVLAEHFIRSGNHQKGAQYSKLAGKRARNKSDCIEAIFHGGRQVSCIEKLPDTDDVKRWLIDSRTTLASYFMNLNYHVDAKEAVAPIADLAIELNCERRLPTIHTAIGSYYLYVEEDYPMGYRHLNKALELSETVEDNNSFWFSNYFLGCHLSVNCDFDKGLTHFRNALNLSEAGGLLSLVSVVKATMGAFNYCYSGRIELGCLESKEAVQIAEEINDMHIKALAYTCHGLSCYFKGSLDEAEAHLRRGVTFCEMTKQSLWWGIACQCLGDLCVNKGEYDTAAEYYRKAVSVLESNRFLPTYIALLKVSLTRVRVLTNEKDINRREIFEQQQRIRIRIGEGWMQRLVAEILVNIEDQNTAEAEESVRKAIDMNKQNDAKWLLADTYALYAELFKRKGELLKAKENLSKAIDIFKECGADGWVERAEKELASIS